MASFEDYIQQYLDPLREEIEGLQQRLTKTEENLAKVLKCLDLYEEDEAVVTASFAAQPGPYTYRPLNSAQNETRILVLYPPQPGNGNDSDPITCELLHASLQQAKDRLDDRSDEAIKSFQTLSYTWGNTKTTANINIEGHRFPVTKNLADALCHIRRLSYETNIREGSKPTPTFWWIDAICINQSNVAERSQQVNLMTRIYRMATGVHIWLGDEADGSDGAMDLVRQLGVQKGRGPGEPDILYPTTSAAQRDINWKTLTALFQRPWWERVWIRQEVAVAKKATVHCGRQTCPFSAFAVTADILNKIDEQLGFGAVQEEREEAMVAPVTKDDNAIPITSSPYLQASVVAGFRTQGGRQPNVKYRDLTELLLHTRACKATDFRDKVFSVLGLVDPEFWDLCANYQLSLNDTLTNTARRIVSRSRSLDIFSVCQNPLRRHGLPSWAPNLIDEWNARPLPTKPSPQLGHVPAEGESDFVFEGDNHELLRATGRRLDTVGLLSKETPQERWTDAQLDALSTSWRMFAKNVLKNKNAHMFDTKFATDYAAEDAAWIKFLSAATDPGEPRLVTVAPLSTMGNYQMVQSLLLPDSANSMSNNGDLPRRIRAQLRKFGVGRRLCITKPGRDKGSVVLVPMDTQTGDEIWAFRGTHSIYVLRKLKDGKYVVVGDVYSEIYFFLHTQNANLTPETIWIV